MRFILSSFLGMLFCYSSMGQQNKFVANNFKKSSAPLVAMAKSLRLIPPEFPGSLDKDGALIRVDMNDWTSGFFPGSLWYAYEYSKDQAMKTRAIQFTEALEPVKNFTGNHDIGFMMYCSYGNAYRLTQNESYKNLLIHSAKTLCKRFSTKTGCIRSWDEFKSWNDGKTYSFPVIIDNMMNLELLFFASKLTGDNSFRDIAVAHAVNTMKNHVRKDYSSFHVVCYDSVNGKVVTRQTAQGYADNSTWARGQAWGIYGFTMAYRETKNADFLKTASGMADYFLNNKNLPDDKIPYWDFNVGESGFTPGKYAHTLEIKQKLRDASAAAITASALLELSRYNVSSKSRYYNEALKILQSLAGENYFALAGDNGNFLLKHSVGSIPHGFGIDKPLSYADYYFLESLHRLEKYKNSF